MVKFSVFMEKVVKVIANMHSSDSVDIQSASVGGSSGIRSCTV